MKIKEILVFLVVTILVFTLANFIVLFHQKIAQQTTIQNMDEIGIVCIKSGEPNLFSLSDNLEFLIKQSSKLKWKQLSGRDAQQKNI